jgi:hypothetical protein
LLKRTDRLYIVFSSVGWLPRQPIIDGCSKSVEADIYLLYNNIYLYYYL